MKSLTSERVAALQVFAAIHGWTWKEELKSRWDHSFDRYDRNDLLLGLRDTHGLKWLEQYELPEFNSVWMARLSDSQGPWANNLNVVVSQHGDRWVGSVGGVKSKIDGATPIEARDNAIGGSVVVLEWIRWGSR